MDSKKYEDVCVRAISLRKVPSFSLSFECLSTARCERRNLHTSVTSQTWNIYTYGLHDQGVWTSFVTRFFFHTPFHKQISCLPASHKWTILCSRTSAREIRKRNLTLVRAATRNTRTFARGRKSADGQFSTWLTKGPEKTKRGCSERPSERTLGHWKPIRLMSSQVLFSLMGCCAWRHPPNLVVESDLAGAPKMEVRIWTIWGRVIGLHTEKALHVEV